MEEEEAEIRVLRRQTDVAGKMLLYVELLAGSSAFRAPFAVVLGYSVPHRDRP